ncbi:hypothetical protein J6590_086169 [Homalodisca vitripennis]|nr:hypothetical protein J6590_086169 [Homalodisca vitripennis]
MILKELKQGVKQYTLGGDKYQRLSGRCEQLSVSSLQQHQCSDTAKTKTTTKNVQPGQPEMMWSNAHWSDQDTTDARPQLYALIAQTKRETGLTLRPVLLRLLTLSKACQARTAILMMMIETGDIDNPTTQTKVYHTTVLAKNRKATDDIGKQLVNVLKESANERRQHEKETLEDQDRIFLMSLIKDFKNIPQHGILSAKRQILLVIEQNQSLDLSNMGSSQSLRCFGLKTQPTVDMTRGSTSKDLQ